MNEEFAMCFLFTNNRTKVLLVPATVYNDNTVRMLKRCVYGKNEDPKHPRSGVGNLFFEKTEILVPPSKWVIQGTINKHGKGTYTVFAADVDRQSIQNSHIHSRQDLFDVWTDCRDPFGCITACSNIQLDPFDEIAYRLVLNRNVVKFHCKVDPVETAKEAYLRTYCDPEIKRSGVTHTFYVHWVYDRVPKEQEASCFNTELIAAENKDEAEFIVASREYPDPIRILKKPSVVEHVRSAVYPTQHQRRTRYDNISSTDS